MKTIKRVIKRGLSTFVGAERAQSMSGHLSQRIQKLEYDVSTAGRASKQHLKAVASAYQGERCVIIGNGPSLRNTDLSLIKDEFTFGLNRIYLNYETMGYQTSCLVCVNHHVMDQWGPEFDALNIPKYFDWKARGFVRPDAQTTFFRSVTGPKFSTCIPEEGLWQGATVTYAAMQLAYHMGFSQVILIGVDHSFVTQGPAHQLVTSEGDDPNHFHPDYFGKGSRWQLPDLETSEIAYGLARKQFESSGRRIVDATIGGKLTVLPKSDLRSLLSK